MCRHPTVQQEVNNLHGAHTQEPTVSSVDRIFVRMGGCRTGGCTIRVAGNDRYMCSSREITTA